MTAVNEHADIAIMADETAPETPLSRALKERKELKEIIRAAMEKLEKIEQFLSMYRQFTVDETSVEKGGGEAVEQPTIGKAFEWGRSQEGFDTFIRQVLREVGRPMRSAEVVDEFQRRGHPIGGSNELKQAWNRLWAAKTRKAIINLPGLGYWLPDEPLTPEAEAKAIEARKAYAGRTTIKSRAAKNRIAQGFKNGRPSKITDAHRDAIRHDLLFTEKPVTQIAAEHAISPGSVNYLFGSRKILREKYAAEIKAVENLAKPKDK